MPAAYDNFDYPLYWKGRDYEHLSETIALEHFLKRIGKINTVVDIGGGFGRLTPIYKDYADKIILTDPSKKLLNIAKKNLKTNKINFINASYRNLPKKIKTGSIDLVVLIRVLHHIKEPKDIIEVAGKLLKKDGYFILEFANKRHIKASLSEFLRGNFTFILDIFPKDINSAMSKRKKTLPFFNYHPDKIKDFLTSSGFEILELRSVSNIRVPLIKKIIPLQLQITIEKKLQKIFARASLGPSIFYLAQKRINI